jgi:hypothetical protein
MEIAAVIIVIAACMVGGELVRRKLFSGVRVRRSFGPMAPAPQIADGAETTPQDHEEEIEDDLEVDDVDVEEAPEGDESGDADEDDEDATVLERFETDGFVVTERTGMPRESMLGRLRIPDSDAYCDEEDCDGDAYELHEVVTRETQLDDPNGQKVEWNFVGRFCDACGLFEREDDALRAGVFGKLGKRCNIFDFLDRLKGPPSTAAEGESDEALAARESILEGELNTVRIKRLSLAQQDGRIDPYRGTPEPHQQKR